MYKNQYLPFKGTKTVYEKFIVTKQMKYHGSFFTNDLLKLQKIEME